MSPTISETIVRKYWDPIWQRYTEERRQKNEMTFRVFLQEFLEEHQTEIQLRVSLGIVKGTIADIPQLLVEYSVRNSYPPSCIVAGTREKIWWECRECGHEWQARGANRAKESGTGCPSCAHQVVTAKNNLSVTHPHLAVEYSTRNILLAHQVFASTNKNLWWRCYKCGHEWKNTGNNRVKGSGCPACANKITTIYNNLLVTHPLLAAEYSVRNALPVDAIVAGTNKKLWWKCRECGYEWQSAGHTRVGQGSGCPACANKVVTPDNNLAATHPELAKEYSKRNTKPPTKIVAGTEERIWWKCRKCGHEWQVRGANRMRGGGCPACVGRAVTATNNLAVTHPELLIEYSERNTMKSTEVIATTAEKLWWRCWKCQYEWRAVGYTRAAGTGCPACKNKVVTSMNNLAATHPELAKEYSCKNSLPSDKSIAGTKEKLCWLCSICGYEWVTSGANRVRGSGCPACSKPPRVVTSTNNLAITHPGLAKEYSPLNALLPDKVIAGTSKKLWWVCSVCGHEWQAVGFSRVGGTGCPRCGRMRALATKRS